MGTLGFQLVLIPPCAGIDKPRQYARFGDLFRWVKGFFGMSPIGIMDANTGSVRDFIRTLHVRSVNL